MSIEGDINALNATELIDLGLRISLHRGNMEHSVTNENRSIVALDLRDRDYELLSRYAGRIRKLLTSPVVQANPDAVGSLDDFLGAVYALIRAKQHDFKDRTAGPIEIAAIEKRARDIADGNLRTDGRWVAGFYFNNALFRTAAVYHRILKIATKSKGWVHDLSEEARGLYPGWTCGKLDMVHSQVNDLKHTPRGIHDQRTATFADAVAAVDELLAIIEAWTAACGAESVPKE